jgi:hypothetical protein
LLSLISTSCEKDKKDEPERPKVYLTVQISDGIDSNYKPGVYEYDTGMSVNYFFRMLEGYVNLRITLDGRQVCADSSFFMHEDHTLKAEAEHKTLWRFDIGIPVYFSAPAIGDNGTIYFGSGMYGNHKGTLYALNPDGTLKWSYQGTSALYSPAIGEDGNIYIQDVYDKVVSITPDGAFRWSYSNYPTPNTQNVGQRCPAIGTDGTVYVASDGLYALNPLNGSLKWVFMQRSSTKASPSIGADGTIYVVFSQDLLVAVNPDGTEKWHNSFTYPWEMSFTSPAIDHNGVIYLGAEARYEGVDLSSVYAFNPDSTLKWKYDVEGIRWVRASPVIDANGNIIVATKANETDNPAMVIAISPQGQKLWGYTLENIHVTADDIYCTPAIDNNGLIYLSAETGYFYVLNPNGTLNFSYMLHAGVNWSSPAISSDSVLFMGGMFGPNYEGSFFAIKISSNRYASSPWPKFRHDNHNSGRF